MAKSKWNDIKDKLTLVEGWARDGLTNEQIAEKLRINPDTLYRYKKKHPEFSESLKRGKEVVDYQVENALLKNALEGNVTAQIYWLNNRKPKQWKNKRDSIIKELESDGEGYHREDLRQIYIEEQYYDKLFHSVMTTPLFEIVARYEKYLKKDFEKQLLEAYQKIVDEKSRFTGKRNYEEVIKILQHMKILKDGEKLVEKMIEEYKVKYANRRLMLEELDKIGK